MEVWSHSCQSGLIITGSTDEERLSGNDPNCTVRVPAKVECNGVIREVVRTMD